VAKLSIFVPFPESIRNKRQQNQIADAIVTHIVGRTIAGLDKEDKKFSKYTKKYAKDKGVGVGEVDLLLSGEMLSELKPLKITADGVEIGYKGSKELVGKVEGNILGTYGQPEPIPGKARDFLGIDDDAVDVIISAYQEELDEQPRLSEEDLDRIAREAAREILGDIDFDTEINE
jgi:hypothetical protein